MKKVLWTKYFRLKPGYSTRFVVPGFPTTIDLNDENTTVETLKQLYDLKVDCIELTEDGEKKYFPAQYKKRASGK
jgi:hypothetical protein